MEVILLKRVENLGNLGDRVNVKPGYGRNFLIPGGKATPATEEHIKAFEARRAELEAAAATAREAAEARREKMTDMVVTIKAKAGEEGKLFGSVGNADIAEAINAAGVEVERSEVRMPEGPFRQIGEYMVTLHLHTDVDGEIKVIIEAE
ncbi:MAG: 50S ribosomal protein L9 [Thiogranum sp.]|nr:50S ribosomal protein L9 [Thiogranum sp.]